MTTYSVELIVGKGREQIAIEKREEAVENATKSDHGFVRKISQGG